MKSNIAVIIVTAALACLPCLALAAPPAKGSSDDVVQFDPRDSSKKQQFESLDAGTVDCLGQAMRALLMQGARSKTQLFQFAENLCGAQLKKLLTSSGMTEAEANHYIRKESEDALAYELTH